MDLKSFITEDKIEEDRKRRQAEWERVRKPSDPIEAPSDVFDNRTLFEKLKEQHELKKRDFEDQFALKNQIRGIDTDEAQFLDEIDRVKLKQEKLKKIEEKKELEEYKKAIENKASLNESIPKIHITVQKKDKKQSELLAKVVVPKRKKDDDENEVDNKRCKGTVINKIKPIVAILPGVGEYNSNSSSSSEYSSDDEIHNPTDHAKDTSSLFTSHVTSGGANSGASDAAVSHENVK